ncbi:hypothetical protein [Streptomyces sp. NPDC088254]|uniref:hypothetical protein n=1 Tax=Streptomyces sp. NPDC088254 TaxID=3365847 RepID=UPI0038027A5B
MTSTATRFANAALCGEDHLRQVTDTFDSPAAALLAFEKVHGAEMRPGPVPLTDTERAAAEARAPLSLTAAKAEPARPEPETVPACRPMPVTNTGGIVPTMWRGDGDGTAILPRAV